MFKWHGRFKDGRRSIADDERCGRPPNVRSTLVRKVRDMIHEDRLFTVKMLATEVQTSKDSVHRILKEHLHMNKVCVRWVPRLLSTEHKTKRFQRNVKSDVGEYNRRPVAISAFVLINVK